MEIHVYQGYMLVTNLLHVKLYLRLNIFLNTGDSTNKTIRTRANYSEVRLESNHLTGEERLPFLEQLFKYNDYQVPETSNCQTFHVSTCLKNKKKNFCHTSYQCALSHKAWKAEAVSFDYIELFYETAHTTMHYTFFFITYFKFTAMEMRNFVGGGASQIWNSNSHLQHNHFFCYLLYSITGCAQFSTRIRLKVAF